VLSEHTSTVEERLAPAAPTVPAEGPREHAGAILLLVVVAAELAWGALLAWFVVGLFV
jgi:hypothetical protein